MMHAEPRRSGARARTRMLVGFLGLLLGVGMGAMPEACRADAYDEFRIPENTSHLATFQLTSFGSHGLAQLTNIGRSDALNMQYDGSLFDNWIREREASTTSISGSAAGNGTFGHSFSSVPVVGTNQADWRQQALEQIAVTVQHTRYVGPRDLSWGGGASMSTFWSQGWTHRWSDQVSGVNHQRNEFDSRSRSTRPSWSLQGTAGIGRVRNVTGIGDALLLEKRLRASGRLRGPLSAGTRQRLAEVFYLYPSLFSTRDRPAMAAWAEIDRILAEDGALAGTALSPHEAILGAENEFTAVSGIPGALAPAALTRQRGASATLSLQFGGGRQAIWSESHSVGVSSSGGPETRTEAYSSSASRFILEETHLIGSLRYNRPLGLERIMSMSATLNRSLRIDQQYTTLAYGASGTQVLTDRLLLSLVLNATRSYPHGPQDRLILTPGYSTSGSASLAYFLEDHVTVRLALFDTQTRQLDRYRHQNQVTLGVLYRFRGLLDSAEFPGLAHTGPGMGIE